MSDTYTPDLRLQIPTVGGDSNTWGSVINTDLSLIEASITGIATIALSGTATTLTANNGATDQARCALYQFTGTLTTPNTVTIPQSAKIGYVQNFTQGYQTLTLTTGYGGGTVANIGTYSGSGVPPALFFVCDGQNVTVPSTPVSTIIGPLTVTTSTLTSTINTPLLVTGGAIFDQGVNATELTVAPSGGNVTGGLTVDNITAVGTITARALFSSGATSFQYAAIGTLVPSSEMISAASTVVFQNIPTSVGGLAPGQIWRNGTTLMIV